MIHKTRNAIKTISAKRRAEEKSGWQGRIVRRRLHRKPSNLARNGSVETLPDQQSTLTRVRSALRPALTARHLAMHGAIQRAQEQNMWTENFEDNFRPADISPFDVMDYSSCSGELDPTDFERSTNSTISDSSDSSVDSTGFQEAVDKLINMSKDLKDDTIHKALNTVMKQASLPKREIIPQGQFLHPVLPKHTEFFKTVRWDDGSSLPDDDTEPVSPRSSTYNISAVR